MKAKKMAELDERQNLIEAIHAKVGQIKISKTEKGVPIPKQTPRPRSPNSILSRAANLNPGESFFVLDRGTRHVAPVLSRLHTSTKMRFTVRAMDGGVRVWRIK